MRKRFYLPLLVLTTLLCLCSSSSAAEGCEHRAVCTAPTVCISCGAEGLTSDEVSYFQHNMVYTNLGARHEGKCTDCSYTEAPDVHYGYCTPPTCWSCGPVDALEPLFIYHKNIEFKNLGDQCQGTCVDCGYAYEAQPHWLICPDFDNCGRCGATGLNGSREEADHYDTTSTDEGESHRETCNDCGYSYTEYHWGECTTPNKCFICMLTGVTIPENRLLHNHPEDVPDYDATTHTFTCLACQQVITGEHEPSSDDSSTCWLCKHVIGTSARVPGDTSGDGVTDMRDALRLLRSIAGWDVEINDKAADVNGDGSVDMRDALRLLRYIAGWDVTLQ
ncbi:MAG: hypothetical protein IJ438_08770 [Clostridia bacterium]|nr:hypothetical protein [Clostridia bacterium]